MLIKRNSRAVERSKQRLEGLKSISPLLDLGNGISVEDYILEIEMVETALAEYNRSKSALDGQNSALKVLEKRLKDYHERSLIAVAAKYGKDSIEYVRAGGTRKSERKRPRRWSVTTEGA